MKKNTAQQKKLQEILSQKRFEELEPFKSTTTWNSLSAGDRNLLASLFVLQGENQLQQGDKNARESFDLAAQVAPDNSEIFCRIGCAFANHQVNYTCLKQAEEAFQKALKIDDRIFLAWLTLGNVYNSLGTLNNEACNFQQADLCFQQALKFITKENEDKTSHVYWYWGLSWYFLGKHSGEAVDYLAALDKFRTAEKLGLQDKYFWNAYGDTLAEAACLLGKHEHFFEVVELYRNGVRQAFDFYEGWLNLGCAYQRLFELYYSEEYYKQAGECFKMASQINDSHSFLWLKWAQLIATAGKIYREIEVLRDSFEKFEKADACEPHQATILSYWGQALMLYGANTENVEKIREAQQKILLSLEIDPESVDTWYYYGACLIELGRYFGEDEYYLEAIEKFQYGLKLKKNEPMLWYGLALAHYAIGDMRSDAHWIEKAAQIFSKVHEVGGQHLRQFWNDWGVSLMKLAELTNEKNYVESAIDKFENAIGRKLEDIDVYEIDPEWLYNYGCALDFLGDFNEDIGCYEKAIIALSKALQMDPEYMHARYNLALAFAHLGELAMDVDCFHKSIENFQLLLSHDSEDEMGWNDYGLTLMHLSQLIYDPSRPDQTQKLYEVAEGKLMQAVALGCTQSYYNLACLHSLTGNYPMAMHFLERSDAAGVLPPIDDILHDEWLEGLRHTVSFRNFISHFPNKPQDQ